MRQNYKIFTRRALVLLTKDASQYQDDRSTLLVHVKQKNDLKDVIEYSETRPFHSRIVLVHPDLSALFDYFSDYYRRVEAAGGIVWDANARLLIIYRHQMWDLPKGKIENSEKPGNAAKREVMEECGVRDLEIVNHAFTTYHTYFRSNQYVLKKTYWYKMNCGDPENISPQEEEGITEIKWMEKTRFDEYFKNTFPNLKEMLRQVLKVNNH